MRFTEELSYAQAIAGRKVWAMTDRELYEAMLWIEQAPEELRKKWIRTERDAHYLKAFIDVWDEWGSFTGSQRKVVRWMVERMVTWAVLADRREERKRQTRLARR